ncbi:MAG: transglycosylase SLT domain-containing protein [Gemmatimonadales bacterium]|nr:transglycosylase SLT domain-containing protein [Gemmatimonadales bacterium]
MRVVLRGALVLAIALSIGAVAGWTRGVRAADDVTRPDAAFVDRQFSALNDQVEAARGETAVLKLQLVRATNILERSARYQIPADLSAAIYDIALSEGIDPALGYQLVKIESQFKGAARSNMAAFGFTQLQVPTARFYKGDVTERDLMDRDINLRIGFRFLNDLLVQYHGDKHLALVAYNRGPAKVREILAAGGNPRNGYSEMVLKGYQPLAVALP